MTPLDLAMKAGRELDALVAQKVLGWYQHTDYGYREFPQIEWRSVVNGHDQYEKLVNSPDQMPEIRGWRPSTDIAAAWEVVERFTKRGQAVFIDSAGFNGEEWRVIISIDDPEGQLPVEAATAPLAICLAALKAVEASA